MVAHLNLNDLTGAIDAGREGVRRVDDQGGRLHYNLACVQARLGDVRGGLVALTEAARLGYANVGQLETDPELEPLRGEPGFSEVLEQARRTAQSRP